MRQPLRGDPLAYLHGPGKIIPGVETALEGKVEGDTLQVSIEPEQGYGVRDERLVQVVPRSAFKGVESIEPGMRFQAQGPEGSRSVVVTEVATDVVTIDANHPLAGVTLHFDVEVSGIREATEEELAHGHVHGPGGHHH
ncbi:MAG: FKBP-type peptidyl-prolyl cis-trans isomerase [Steroidobacteraceae bacterium]